MKKIILCAFALSLTAVAAVAQTTGSTQAVVDASVPSVPLGTAGVTGVFTTAAGLTFGFLAGVLVLLTGASSSSSSSQSN